MVLNLQKKAAGRSVCVLANLVTTPTAFHKVLNDTVCFVNHSRVIPTHGAFITEIRHINLGEVHYLLVDTKLATFGVFLDHRSNIYKESFRYKSCGIHSPPARPSGPDPVVMVLNLQKKWSVGLQFCDPVNAFLDCHVIL